MCRRPRTATARCADDVVGLDGHARQVDSSADGSARTTRAGRRRRKRLDGGAHADAGRQSVVDQNHRPAFKVLRWPIPPGRPAPGAAVPAHPRSAAFRRSCGPLLNPPTTPSFRTTTPPPAIALIDDSARSVRPSLRIMTTSSGGRGTAISTPPDATPGQRPARPDPREPDIRSTRPVPSRVTTIPEQSVKSETASFAIRRRRLGRGCEISPSCRRCSPL
jgi:hypothetical protein